MSSDMISEKVSVKRRGRPKVILRFAGASFERELRAGLPTGCSDRTVLNKFYEARAVGTLMQSNGPELRWLIGRKTVLYELGRIDDDETLRAAADIVHRRKPRSVRDAVLIVRRIREAKTGPADPRVLARHMATVIDRYVAAHPDAVTSVVERALQIVGNVVREDATVDPTECNDA